MIGLEQSDYSHYLELNRKYEEMRLQVLSDMEKTKAFEILQSQPQNNEKTIENEGPKNVILNVPTILEDYPIKPVENTVENDREKFYKLFVEPNEKTVVIKSPQEERKKERRKKRKHSKKAKKNEPITTQTLIRKYQAKSMPVMSTKDIRNELNKKMKKIQSRLVNMQNKAHEELVYGEDELSIKNMELLEKLFPTFLEMFAVKWEDIADLLIDDLLSDTVAELNIIDTVKKNRWVEENYDDIYEETKNNKENKGGQKSNVDLMGIFSEYFECEKSIGTRYGKNLIKP